MARTLIAHTLSTQSTDELHATLAALKEQEEQLGTTIADKRKKLAALNAELLAAQNTERNVEGKIRIITNTIFARAPFPPLLLRERTQLIAKIRLSKSEEITIAAQKTLCAEIAAAKTALQAHCTHRFVFSYDGYEGSSSHDYDDSRHGHRVCPICDLHEESRGTRENLYKILVEDTTRLVRRDLREKKDIRQEWFHIAFLKRLFEDSAYGVNVDWPEQLDPSARGL